LKDNTFIISRKGFNKPLFSNPVYHRIILILIKLTYYLISLILLFSGVTKVLNPQNLITALNTTLGFLNEEIILLIATVLPVFELTVGMLLILRIKIKEVMKLAIVLFTVFSFYSFYGTIRGYDVDCGCFGESVTSEFGIWMIFRNILLTVIAFLNFKYFKSGKLFEKQL
jgi:hypothetical protein